MILFIAPTRLADGLGLKSALRENRDTPRDWFPRSHFYEIRQFQVKAVE